jgi:hypothetical protein
VNITAAAGGVGAVLLGLSQSFTATVTFSDSTTQIATPYVQWTTSNPAIAVVARSGIAFSTGKGTANISASLEGISGFTTLTVQ